MTMKSMKIGKQMIALLVIYAFMLMHVHAAVSINGTDASEDRAFKSDGVGKSISFFFVYLKIL